MSHFVISYLLHYTVCCHGNLMIKVYITHFLFLKNISVCILKQSFKYEQNRDYHATLTPPQSHLEQLIQCIYLSLLPWQPFKSKILQYLLILPLFEIKYLKAHEGSGLTMITTGMYHIRAKKRNNKNPAPFDHCLPSNH